MISLEEEIYVLRVEWAKFDPLTARYTKSEYIDIFDTFAGYSGKPVRLSELESNLDLIGESAPQTALPEKLQETAVSARQGKGKTFYLVEGRCTGADDFFDERLELGILTYPDLNSGPKLMPLIRIYFEREST